MEEEEAGAPGAGGRATRRPPPPQPRRRGLAGREAADHPRGRRRQPLGRATRPCMPSRTSRRRRVHGRGQGRGQRPQRPLAGRRVLCAVAAPRRHSRRGRGARPVGSRLALVSFAPETGSSRSTPTRRRSAAPTRTPGARGRRARDPRGAPGSSARERRPAHRARPSARPCGRRDRPHDAAAAGLHRQEPPRGRPRRTQSAWSQA